MEGPSIFLAAEQLQPFVGRRVTKVSGNSRVGIDRFQGKRVTRVFAWGKHLVLQFDMFALRVHFMLWGTFAATVNGVSVTGDYRRTGPPRLVLEFANGEITMWSASLRILDSTDAREEYDFTADILSESWNRRGALRKIKPTGGRKSPMSCWTRASSRASATSSRTRCCCAPGPARSRESTDSRPPSCDESPTRRAHSHSASSNCGESLLCASSWKSMDAARACRAEEKFPARSTASAAAAVFSARSASARVRGRRR